MNGIFQSACVKGSLCAVILIWAAIVGCAFASAASSPFVGRWALTSEGGGPGWLEIRQQDGVIEGSLLWVGGSPEPLTRVYFDRDTLHGLRVRDDEIRDASGKVVRTQVHPILLTATLQDEILTGVLQEPTSDGARVITQAFTGRRVPALPPPPDRAKAQWGEPVVLFNGRNLDGWNVKGGAYWGVLKIDESGSQVEGWIAVDPNVANGWSVNDGVLMNDPVQHEGQPYARYGNLQTEAEFNDFRLTLDVKLPPDGNSGIYLRGIYEVQLRDSFQKPLDCHNMGALYGRITPARAAERPAGEWQNVDITLLDRYVTIVLNGETIIDNQPIAGCTGGALWSDESRPGPIYLQGDHTAVGFRNVTIRPRVR